MTYINETPDAPVTLPGELVIFEMIYPIPVPVPDCVPCPPCEDPPWETLELPPDFVIYN